MARQSQKARSSSSANLSSPFNLFKASVEAVKRNLSLFIFLNTLTILGAAWQIGSDIHNHVDGKSWDSVIFSNSFLGTGSSYPRVGGGIILGLLFVAAIVLGIMTMILQVKAALEPTVRWDEVWQTFKRLWWKIIFVEVLTTVVIIAGFIALILPGIYLVGRLILAPYALIAEDTKIFEALERSWVITKGKMWPVYNVVLLGLVLSLLGVLPVIGPVVGTVLAIAYSVVLPLRYKELKSLAH